VKAASSGGLLLLLGAGLGVAAVSAGVFFYRGLPRFGEAVQVWRKPMVTLSAFGAAGAMFSGAMYGLEKRVWISRLGRLKPGSRPG
jgi:hypothetical protein